MTAQRAPRPIIAGRYRVERRLAQGGMASVFLARDLVLHRDVAIKVLSERYANDANLVTCFQREALSAGQLSHPNIVAVYDSGTDGLAHYIAMEYVEGCTLTALLEDEGRLSVDDANKIATEVAGALAVAHRLGIVHRDIKPSNILITADGSAKVADFGIARALDSDVSLTETGKVMGTATYFSPEQAQGRPIDPRSDLYSLGVVLFEMVTGYPPFRASSPVSVASQHVDEQPPLTSSWEPDVPADLDLIVGRLLTKDPARRYPSSAALIMDLDRLWNGEAVDRATAREARQTVVASKAIPIVASTRPDRGLGARTPKDATRADAPGERATLSSAQAEAPPVRPRPVLSEIYPTDCGRPWVSLLMLTLLLASLIGLVVATQRLANAGPSPGDLVVVPALIGDSEAAAANRLANADLVVALRYEPTDKTEPGLVFEQDPSARTAVEPGTVVTIVVASTRPPTESSDAPGETVDVGPSAASTEARASTTVATTTTSNGTATGSAATSSDTGG